jgi:hypothetical protein
MRQVNSDHYKPHSFCKQDHQGNTEFPLQGTHYRTYTKVRQHMDQEVVAVVVLLLLLLLLHLLLQE